MGFQAKKVSCVKPQMRKSQDGLGCRNFGMAEVGQEVWENRTQDSIREGFI